MYWQCGLWLQIVVVAGVFVTAGYGTSTLYQRLKMEGEYFTRVNTKEN